MMTKIWLLICFFILCPNYFSQSVEDEKNKIIPDPETGEPMLIGYFTREAFNDTSFSEWFNPEYESYIPDSSAIEALKDKMSNIDITLVAGTWCSDSHEEVPHLYKILDVLGYPTEKMTLIAVDLDKKTESSEIDGLEIELSPTIIFYHDGSEIGRIIERPNKSLEQDMLKILSE
jgi:thiol-disulfide isomerase/thioredoxin